MSLKMITLVCVIEILSWIFQCWVKILFLDNFSECHQKCEGFLQSMLFREQIAKDDLYTLTGT